MPTKRPSPKPKRPLLTARRSASAEAARELARRQIDAMTPRERAFRALDLGRLCQRLADAHREDGEHGGHR